MSELKIINTEGKAVGKHKLAKTLDGASASNALLHRVVVAEQANARQGTSKTKTRSEARGGGQKPYRQKKTGRARQGSIRSPHYAHGGHAFALRPRDYSQKVNKKERRAAIVGAFNKRIEDGDLSVVDKIAFGEIKTKSAVAFLKALGLDGVKRVLLILPEYDEIATKCFRNLQNVELRTAPSTEGKSQAFSTRDLLIAHKIVVAQDALKRIEEVWSK